MTEPSDASSGGETQEPHLPPPALSCFQYGSLRPSQIRLLKFNKSQDNVPHCSLQTYDLKGPCPSFRALSYTWGPATNVSGSRNTNLPAEISNWIECDGCLIKVTSNLFDACHQLQQNEPGHYFWIDAVCINQQNLDERARQILLMGDIYGTAEEVIVWLGKVTPLLEELIWATDVLLPKLDMFTTVSGQGEIYSPPIGHPAVCLLLGEDQLLSRLYRFCMFCGSRRWFRRLWTLQEVVRAQKIKLQCGPCELSWSRAVALSRHLRVGGWESQIRVNAVKAFPESTFEYNGTEFTKPNAHRDMYHGLDRNGFSEEINTGLGWMFGAFDSVTRRFAQLLYYVHAARTYEALDPRDKIYAVLGLVDRHFHEGVASYVTPDYELPVEDVYRQVTTVVLERVPLLTSLSFVEDMSVRRFHRLPSWVPDYSVSPPAKSFIFLGRGGIFEPLLCPESTPASRKIENDILYCTGADFDTVDRVCPFTVEELWVQHKANEILRFCTLLPLTHATTNQNRVECLWRTLIADTLDLSHPAPVDTQSRFADFIAVAAAYDIEPLPKGGSSPLDIFAVLHTLNPDKTLRSLPDIATILAYRELLLAIDTDKQNPTRDLELTARVTKIDERFLPYTKQMADHVSAKRLFITRKGLLGMGPASTEVGDAVWFFYDSMVPFVLRGPRMEDDGHFRLVGECYLHGFMHGEVLEHAVGWKERVGLLGLA